MKVSSTLGLFENPYIDASKAAATIGSDANRAKGLDIQKKSIVLLQNQDQAAGKTLPLKAGAKVYTMGMGKADVEKYGFTVTDGNYDATKGQTRPSAAGADYAVIRVLVKDAGSAYSSKDPATGANPLFLNPLTRHRGRLRRERHRAAGSAERQVQAARQAAVRAAKNPAGRQ